MATKEFSSVKFETILEARDRIKGYVSRTAVVTSTTFNRLSGAQVFFKCENLQKTGSFKVRGAHNAVLCLSDIEAAAGVVTHSSGNHAAALSLAAKSRGIPAYIVMPHGSPETKIASVERLGGIITMCEPTLAAREAACEALKLKKGAALVHPYNDVRVIAGQGTAALELMEDYPDLDVLIAPVGGGGLLSGSAIAAHGKSSRISVIGAEPLGASDAFESMAKGQLVPLTSPVTIADGLRACLGPFAFELLKEHQVAITTVSEEAIVAAMKLVFEVLKLVIEPSAAVGVAALLDSKLNLSGKKVGVILCGGNVDLDKLPWIKRLKI